MALQDDESFEGQVQIWNATFGFAISMAVKAAVELKLADIIADAGHGASVSLDHIASQLPSNTVNKEYLYRIMQFLVKKKIFCESEIQDASGATYIGYGLTKASEWLKTGKNQQSLAKYLIFELDGAMISGWQQLSRCVLEGGYAFEKAHSIEIFEYASQNPSFNDVFNEAMAADSKICLSTVLENYHGFANISSLVDVGGGLGFTLATIVRKYPNLKCTNLDLPHVLANAPEIPGVSHVEGDMFKSIPVADAVMMKRVMHDWDDESCVQILKNCCAALPSNGKVIIIEVVIDPVTDTHPLSDVRMAYDLLMMAVSRGGKERTEKQWKDLLLASGFPIITINRINYVHAVIEASKSD